MLFFNTFDYGKSLLKQLEQLRKLPLQQQAKREQQILKAYEKFVQQYRNSLNNTSSANPALLKTGAEALVEAATQLREPRLAYQVYAEMVARSRKVPVVPGLATLVDRMLELPTEQKEERNALLGWRIVTGSMRPEKQLAYLAERAELSGAVSDWKDFSWNVSQLINKGSLQANDPLVLDALNLMLKNKSKLGDRLAPVQILMAEAQIAQGKYRQAEIQLTDVATEAKRLPEKFLSLVADLVAKYPETNWMLQKMLLEPTITSLLEGKVNWTTVQERLDRARGYTTDLLEFLLEHPKLIDDDRLGLYALERIGSLERPIADPLFDRWREIYRDAGREQPAGTAEVVEKAVAAGHLTKRDVAKVASIELGPSLLASTEREDIARVLNSNVPLETLSAERVDEINSELAHPDIPDWIIEEARLWLAERLARLGRMDSAARQLTSIPVLSEKHAAQLYPRIATMFSGSTPPPQIQSLLARMSLLGGDYHGAFAAAQQLPADNAARGQLLSALEEWILSQVDAPPKMLLVLAQTQRLSHGDPAAGLQAVTTASLLAPEDTAVQQAYHTWEHALAPEAVYAQRAQQAVYLAEQQRKLELIPVALEAIEKLENAKGDEGARESIPLLATLQPLLVSLPLEEQHPLTQRWARVFLMVHFKQRTTDIDEVIAQVSRLVSGEELMSLLGEFAGQLEPNLRLQVEWAPALRAGRWERALGLAEASTGELIGGLVEIPLFTANVPAESLLDAARRMGNILSARGDDAGELQLIRGMYDRLGEGNIPHADELRTALDAQLERLSQELYEPAIRYRMDLKRAAGDLDAIAPDLISLARTGDDEAVADLSQLYEQRLKTRERPEQLKEMALVLAAREADYDPKRAVEFLTRAGRAIGEGQWAVQAIAELELNTETAEGLALIAELALQQGDLPRAGAVMQRLTELGAIEQAQQLADALALAQPDTPAAMQNLLLVQLAAQPRDVEAARMNLLKLVDMLRAGRAELSDGLQPVLTASDNALAYDTSAGALRFRITLALLVQDYFKAASLITELIRSGEPATSVLELLQNLGVTELDLPPGLAVPYGRALFSAGKVEEALALLSGLHDSVVDYPEYIALLEEIKESVGGPNPSLQLAEAYLRVHLWQRSADEYMHALEQEPGVADVVLAQLREQDALAPNPAKYPLHVAGLAATAYTSRYADWAWAISALSWLTPRVEPSELAPITARMWERAPGIRELEPQEFVQLALQLHQLALRQGDHAAALDYLVTGWKRTPLPGPELREALSSFDRGRLPADPALQEKLLELELDAALAEANPEQVMSAAQRLAEVSERGRQLAASALDRFQAEADKPALVVLSRMRLLDVQDADARQRFVEELLRVAGSSVPADQVTLLRDAVQSLLHQVPDDEYLQLALLKLLRQTGDNSTARQFAVMAASSAGPVADAALAELAEAAADEPHAGWLETLAAVQLTRGDADGAARTLLKLAPDSAKPEGAAVAEALLETQNGDLREWLVSYYRTHGLEQQAAEHVLWAQQAGYAVPAQWMADSDHGEILLRAAQLAGLRGDPDERRLYGRALAAADLSQESVAAAALRLALLSEQAGELDQARELLARAEGAGGATPELEETRQRITQSFARQRLQELQLQPDSEQRIIELAQLMRDSGDVAGAIKELQDGIGRGFASPALSVELAESFMVYGDLNLARRAFADVLKKLEGTGGFVPELRLRASYGLGRVEESLGNTGEAIAALEDILVQSANYRDVRQLLESLYTRQRGAAAPSAQPAAAAAPAPPAPAAVPSVATNNSQPSAGKDELLDEILALLDLPPDGGKAETNA